MGVGSMFAKLRSRRWLLVMLCTVVFGGLFFPLAFVLMMRDDPFLAEVAFPGGEHRLRLYQTVEGPLEYEWKSSRIEPLLRLLRRSPLPSIHVELNGLDWHEQVPGHSFMFRTVDSRGQYADPNLTMPTFSFVESSGFVFDQVRTADAQAWGTYALTRCALPRRDKELTIRIRPEINAHLIHMKVANPCYRESFPVWQTESLPNTKTRGDLSVTLREVEWLYRSIYFDFDTRSESASWKHCHIREVLEDATGNRGHRLSPFEPAWKVIARTYRADAAQYPPELRTTVKVPILAPGTMQAIDKTIDVAGVQILLVCAGGAGAVETRNGQLTTAVLPASSTGLTRPEFHVTGQNSVKAVSPSPFLWFELVNLLPEDETAVQLVGLDGMRTACQLNGLITATKRHKIAELKPLNGATEVEVNIVINRPEKFEFIVAPPPGAREGVAPK
jgi:hypothetical protein